MTFKKFYFPVEETGVHHGVLVIDDLRKYRRACESSCLFHVEVSGEIQQIALTHSSSHFFRLFLLSFQFIFLKVSLFLPPFFSPCNLEFSSLESG